MCIFNNICTSRFGSDEENVFCLKRMECENVAKLLAVKEQEKNWAILIFDLACATEKLNVMIVFVKFFLWDPVYCVVFELPGENETEASFIFHPSLILNFTTLNGRLRNWSKRIGVWRKSICKRNQSKLMDPVCCFIKSAPMGVL